MPGLFILGITGAVLAAIAVFVFILTPRLNVSFRGINLQRKKEEDKDEDVVWETIVRPSLKSRLIIVAAAVVIGFFLSFVVHTFAIIFAALIFGVALILIVGKSPYDIMISRLADISAWLGEMVALSSTVATLEQLILRSLEQPPAVLEPHRDKALKLLRSGDLDAVPKVLTMMADAVGLLDTDLIFLTLINAREGGGRIQDVLKIVKQQVDDQISIYRRLKIVLNPVLFEIRTVLILSFVLLVLVTGPLLTTFNVGTSLVLVISIIISSIIIASIVVAAYRYLQPKPRERILTTESLFVEETATETVV